MSLLHRSLFPIVVLTLAAALITFGCSSNSGDGNILSNGGFEDDRDPWISLRPPDWQLTTTRARSGESSAYLKMRETTSGDEAKIHYLVTHLGVENAPIQLDSALREEAPSELPEVISGNYFVENWVRGTESQYLQFVVVLWTDDPGGLPACPNGDPCPNYQIRYLLAGIAEDPFPIANAKFIYLTSEDPAEGEWVHFERNLREDFENVWGVIPHDLTDMRLLFEVRYDNKTPAEGPLEADVYYDDLYLGPDRSE